MERLVLVQVWMESEYEPGWGTTQRSDGYSLHLTEEALARFVAERTKDRDGPTPACYDFPSGAPYIAQVPEIIYAAMVALGGDGSRHFGRDLPKPLRLTE